MHSRIVSLFLAMFPLVGMAAPARADCKLGVIANLPVTMQGMRASVPTKVNGKDASFWLDSGAFFSIMSRAKADEFGLPLQALPSGFTIMGIGGTASAQIGTARTFGIVGQEIKNVQFLVGGSDAGNGLIGRNLLAIADTEFDLAHGSVKLVNSKGCEKTNLAYWAGSGQPIFTVPLSPDGTSRTHTFRFTVNINGVKVDAAFDSGAPTSLLSRRAAQRAGIDLAGPDVAPLTGLSGFGQHFVKGWVVPVSNVSIGDEQILRTHLDVIDGPIVGGGDGPDMLVGADFMLAHHIYVARGQHRIYFTYSGGKPFLTATPPPPATVASAPLSLPPGTQRLHAPTNPGAVPKGAEEFALRGNARLSQKATADAIADLSEAIRLAPDKADYYADRARAYREIGERDKAHADLDRAIMLAPGNGEFLSRRAFLRLAEKDEAGALADAEAAAKATHSASLDAAELAFLFERLHQPARAVAMLDDVIALHRSDSALGMLLNGRGWARALANIDLDKALADCNTAIKRDGAKATYLDSRGLVYFRKGEWAKARADYDAALKIQPDMAWSLYVRGLINASQGNAEAGQADRKAALAIDPRIAETANGYGIGT